MRFGLSETFIQILNLNVAGGVNNNVTDDLKIVYGSLSNIQNRAGFGIHAFRSFGFGGLENNRVEQIVAIEVQDDSVVPPQQAPVNGGEEFGRDFVYLA